MKGKREWRNGGMGGPGCSWFAWVKPSSERRKGGEEERRGSPLRFLSTALFLSFFLPLLPFAPAEAQTRTVQILHADSVAAETDSSGTSVRRLFGDVALRHDTTLFRAARAAQYESRGEVRLEGNVRITSGTDTLTADRVLYHTERREAQAIGNVRIGDGEAVLFAPSARYNTRTEQATFDEGGRLLHERAELTAPRGTYNTRTKRAQFEGGVTLRDSTSVLTSRLGRYNARTEQADFTEDVQLRQRTTYVEADTLTHFRTNERSRAFGHVVLERVGRRDTEAETDSLYRTFLFGTYAEHDERARNSLVTGRPVSDPLLVQLYTDSTGVTDTTLVRAHRFTVLRRDSLEGSWSRITGSGDVRLVRPRLAAVADSAVFERVERSRRSPTRPSSSPSDRLALYRQQLDITPPPDTLGVPESPPAPLDTTNRSAERTDPPPDILDRAEGSVWIEEDPSLSSTPFDTASLNSVPLDPVSPDPVSPDTAPSRSLAPSRPSVWFDRSQVTGDTLVGFLRDESVERLEVYGGAFVAQRDTILERIRQIGGHQLHAFFHQDSLRLISVWPQAETITFRSAGNGRLGGADRLSADSLAFRFRNDQLREVTGTRGIEGITYGPNITPDPFRLSGYVYTPEKRPASTALLGEGVWEAVWLESRTTRPSPAVLPLDTQLTEEAADSRLP